MSHKQRSQALVPDFMRGMGEGGSENLHLPSKQPLAPRLPEDKLSRLRHLMDAVVVLSLLQLVWSEFAYSFAEGYKHCALGCVEHEAPERLACGFAHEGRNAHFARHISEFTESPGLGDSLLAGVNSRSRG